MSPARDAPRGHRVRLPAGAQPPYRVFVSGVPQSEGEDFRVEGPWVSFSREIVQEGRLGFTRWTLMFFNIAGSYRRNDVVDVEYHRAGRPLLATGLPVEPEEVAPGARDRGATGAG